MTTAFGLYARAVGVPDSAGSPRCVSGCAKATPENWADHFLGHRTAGFTLLEILLALVLLAFVMLGVWGVLAGATRVTHSADAVMAQSESVRTVQQFLRRYISEAGMQPYMTSAKQARMFEGDATSMQYVAPLPMQSGHAGLYLQTLILVKDGNHLVLQLDYSPYTGDVPDDQTPVMHRLL